MGLRRLRCSLAADVRTTFKALFSGRVSEECPALTMFGPAVLLDSLPLRPKSSGAARFVTRCSLSALSDARNAFVLRGWWVVSDICVYLRDLRLLRDGWVEIRNPKSEIRNQMPPPFSKRSVFGLDCEMTAPGATSLVSHTLPPITAPLPMVTRPRMVAPE